MPGGKSRRSMAHLGLSQRLPLRYSLMPSRRQSLQTGSIWRAMLDFRFLIADFRFDSRLDSLNRKSKINNRKSDDSHAAFFGRPAAVVRQRRDVLDGLD